MAYCLMSRHIDYRNLYSVDRCELSYDPRVTDQCSNTLVNTFLSCLKHASNHYVSLFIVVIVWICSYWILFLKYYYKWKGTFCYNKILDDQ